MHLLIAPIFLLCALQQVLCQKWTLMPGWAKQISAKGDGLWAVNQYGTASRWEDGKWVPKGDNVQMIAACGRGCAWARATMDRPDGNALRFNNASRLGQKFEPVGKFSGFLDNINAIAFDSAVGVNTDGRLWRYWYTDHLWKHIIRHDPARGVQVAIGDEDEIWMVNGNNQLYRLAGNKWEKHNWDKRAVYVDVQGPNRVVVTDLDHHAHILTDLGWKYLEGLDCEQPTVNYDSVFCVTHTGAIYRYDIPSEKPEKIYRKQETKRVKFYISDEDELGEDDTGDAVYNLRITA